MRHRFLAAVSAATIVVSGLILTAPVGQAADADTWGFTSTPKKADGSLDFSDWTAVTAPSAGDELGSLDFTRNGISYTITVNAPSETSFGTGRRPLVANVIRNNTDASEWTYSFSGGSGSTSSMYFADLDTSRSSLSMSVQQYYVKSQSGSLAVAVMGTTSVGESDSHALSYSEVLDITSDGRLVHNITFTNTSTTAIQDIGFSALIDTMLNSNDRIPIISHGADSVYIDNGQFRLYLDMLKGDQMLAGPWPSRSTLNNFVNVNGHSDGATIVDGVDTALSYGLDQADLPANRSVSLAFEERLLAPVEVVPQDVKVTYVDDDANGASVPPVAGTVTTLTGMPGDPVGFTTADADAGMPAGYVRASIDNVDVYDIDPAVAQAIVVHLKHHHTVGTMTTARTITYTGAGDLTPQPVVQNQTWTTDTDDLTHLVTYAGPGYPAQTSPLIDGYATATLTAPATGAVTASSIRPTNLAFTVAYVEAVPQNVTVTWVDDDSDQAVVTPVADTVTTYTGMPNEQVGFTPELAAAGAPAGYDVANIATVTTYDVDPSIEQTITVHLAHHHTVGELTTTRTIDYIGPSGIPADVTQSLVWITDTDEVTHVTTYTSSAGYPGVTAPAVSGMHVDKTGVPATEATAATTTKPVNSRVTVTYTKVSASTGGMVLPSHGTGAMIWPLLAAAAMVLGGGFGLRRLLHHN
ncbi:MAG: hypothetical protein LBV00_06125 [Propionibacteriaceae bacterium]|jgi:hypothetical protein|nr:hypothetical protein [Propionibacteriaceae bacterium]